MTEMTREQIDALVNRIKTFLTSHRTSMSRIADYLPHIFEANCYVLFARHYEAKGYTLTVHKLYKKRFRFRFTTSANPWNYSYFVISTKGPSGSEQQVGELRHNQPVSSAWHNGRESDPDKVALFAVDVAVVRPNTLPDPARGTKRKGLRHWVRNQDLLTFGEAKKLAAYPMLLAQFFGVVHEIQPSFVGAGGVSVGRTFVSQGHPFPTLFTSDKLTHLTEQVLQSFRRRKFKVRIVWGVNIEKDDMLLKRLSGAEEKVVSIKKTKGAKKRQISDEKVIPF